MSDNESIKINTNIILKDSNGNPIPVTTPQPEYLVETFNFKGSNYNPSEIITGDKK